MTLRAIRGATQVEVDEREHLLERVTELVGQVLRRNGVSTDDLVSILFTATPDLHAEFPAYAARAVGISDVPLLCAQELDVVGALPRIVRLLAHVETPLARAEIRHVYLHGARELRTDLRRDDGVAG
ncbi:MAG TPA: chorismate mutase [Jiangellaceae bacterium]|nr:chorismate mutase [Jiangellaceae bacterium]